jgi:predicted ATP-dependent serine protease
MDRTRISTGIADLDRALGGVTRLTDEGFQSDMGIVRPSVVLLSAHTGVGSTTLMQQVAANVARTFEKRGTLYVTSDESITSLQMRGQRLRADYGLVWARQTNILRSIESSIEQYGPVMVVIDSVQQIRPPEREDVAPQNTVEHRVAVAKAADALARKHSLCVVLVNHLLKDDEGPTDRDVSAVDVSITMSLSQTASGRELKLSTGKNRFSASVS